MPDIPLLFVPVDYLFDSNPVNDAPEGTLEYVRPFDPWYRLVTGERLNELVTAINELIARLNFQYAQRIITAAGDVTVALGDYQILLNKTVGAATQVTLPDIADFVDGGYNFADVTIKDIKGDAGANNITVTGDAPINGGDGSGNVVLASNFASVRLRALNDKSGWFYA